MVKFNTEQKDFMKSLGINPNKPIFSQKDLCEIEDKVSEKLQTDGFDKNYNLTEIGTLCESILDKLN